MIVTAALALVLFAGFDPGAALPRANVSTECGGGNASPALHWANPPPGTRSFALTVFDPDASSGGFWHWIAYNIPATARGLAAGSGAQPSASSGTFAMNDYGHVRYDGPCPPPGHPHRYVFTLYALDVERISIADGDAVSTALEGHILAQARIAARFGR